MDYNSILIYASYVCLGILIIPFSGTFRVWAGAVIALVLGLAGFLFGEFTSGFIFLALSGIATYIIHKLK